MQCDRHYATVPRPLRSHYSMQIFSNLISETPFNIAYTHTHTHTLRFLARIQINLKMECDFETLNKMP